MFDENLSKNIKALAYEKSIDVERVFKALEDALATAARTTDSLERKLRQDSSHNRKCPLFRALRRHRHDAGIIL